MASNATVSSTIAESSETEPPIPPSDSAEAESSRKRPLTPETENGQDDGGSSPTKTARKQEDFGVHSANKWETMDLGDDERKSKFLRLMGAAKKEHHGKIVIGDEAKPSQTVEASARPARSSEEVRELEAGLETQFTQRLADRLSKRDRKHRGLGYHGDSETAISQSEPPTSSTGLAVVESGDQSTTEGAELTAADVIVGTNEGEGDREAEQRGEGLKGGRAEEKDEDGVDEVPDSTESEDV